MQPVTPESGLVLEGIPMTPTRVEMQQQQAQIMETKRSKPWDTSWFSRVHLSRTLLYKSITDAIKVINYLLTVSKVNFSLAQSVCEIPNKK